MVPPLERREIGRSIFSPPVQPVTRVTKVPPICCSWVLRYGEKTKIERVRESGTTAAAAGLETQIGTFPTTATTTRYYLPRDKDLHPIFNSKGWTSVFVCVERERETTGSESLVGLDFPCFPPYRVPCTAFSVQFRLPSHHLLAAPTLVFQKGGQRRMKTRRRSQRRQQEWLPRCSSTRFTSQSQSVSIRLLLLVLAVLGSTGTTRMLVTASDSPYEEDEMTQYTLGDFQILLIPTPETLPDIDYVLGRSIEQVLDEKFETLFGSGFEYMYVAGVQQVDVLVPGSRRRHQRRQHRMLKDEEGQRRRTPLRVVQSATSTSVIFNGGVIAFDSDPLQDEVFIRNTVKETINEDLLPVLQFEGGPWELIQDVDFTDLEPLPTILFTTTSPTAIPTLTPIASVTPTTIPTLPIPPTTLTPSPSQTPTTESPTAAPFLFVEFTLPPEIELTPTPSTPVPTAMRSSGEESSQLFQSQAAAQAAHIEARNRSIVGGVFGVAFLFVAALSFVRLTRRKGRTQEDVLIALHQTEQQQQQQSRNHKDYADGSSPLEAKEVNFLASAIGVASRQGTGSDRDGTNDVSRTTQYSTAGDLLDSLSVTSEWTLASSNVNHNNNNNTHNYSDNDDSERHYTDGGGSGAGGPSSVASLLTSYPHIQSSRVAAMGYASSETFERDRLVTLQKDLLQSEWTSPPPNMGTTTTDGTLVMMRKPSPPSPKIRLPSAYYNNNNNDQESQGGGGETSSRNASKDTSKRRIV